MDTGSHRHSAARRARSLALVIMLGASFGAAAEPAGTPPPAVPIVKPPMGRVFFTPAERRLHRGTGPVARPGTPDVGGGSHAVSSQIVNGVLSSSTQGRAVWVNGAAVKSSGPGKSAWSDRNGNVWLTDADERTHLLKPGQSIDHTGAIRDLLPPGSVIRR